MKFAVKFPVLLVLLISNSLWLIATCQEVMDRYVYSYMSCRDLIPSHSSLIPVTTTTTTTISPSTTVPPPPPTLSAQLHNGTSSNKSNNTTSPEGIIIFPRQSNSTGNSGSGRRTTSSSVPSIMTTGRPSRRVRPPIANLNADVFITTKNNNLYAPGRVIEILVSSSVPFEGFMAQVLWGKNQIVGTFFDPPPYTETIDCPLLARNRNTTILDDNTPILLNSVTLKWRAPPQNLGRLTFRISVLARNQYKIVKKDFYPSLLPPDDTNSCGVKQNCFRMCPKSLKMCPFAQALFAAVIRPSNNNRTAMITIGFKSGLMNNYGAVAFTKDDNTLNNMDINVCFDAARANSSSDVEVAHLFLKNKEASPMPHQGTLSVNNVYLDGDTLWCDFTRPLIGNAPTSLNLEDPMYMFFFTGHQTEKAFELPRLSKMMKTRRLVKQGDGLPLNSINYFQSKASDFKFKLFALSFISLLHFFI